jgi:hypothetical protein
MAKIDRQQKKHKRQNLGQDLSTVSLTPLAKLLLPYRCEFEVFITHLGGIM